MSRTLSSTLKAAVYGQETDEVLVVLIEIDHADLANPIRVCSNAGDVVSNGNTFVAFPFELTLPDDQDNAAPRASLRIDNVDRQIVQAIRTIGSPPSVRIMVVLASDPDTIEADWDGFTLRVASYDALTVAGEILTDAFEDEPYPAASFTPGRFPGLFT